MRKLIRFSFERIYHSGITLWCGSEMLYINRNGAPELYDAILSIAKDKNNNDGIRLLYLGVINDYIKSMRQIENNINNDLKIEMLIKFNDLNYRIKLRDRT